MRKVISDASASAITAHKALGKAGAAREMRFIFWWVQVAKVNLAATLYAMELFYGSIRKRGLLAGDISLQTSQLLEMCALTAEMWEYISPVSIKNNAHEVSKALRGLTKVLLPLMSAVGKRADEKSANEIKAAITRLRRARIGCLKAIQSMALSQPRLAEPLPMTRRERGKVV